MAKKVARGKATQRPAVTRRRKVTYSLPAATARELDRRSTGSQQSKSQLVAEALAFYFAAEDRRALGALYAEAAHDPQFMDDNTAVLEDFAVLDREVDGPSA